MKEQSCCDSDYESESESGNPLLLSSESWRKWCNIGFSENEAQGHRNKCRVIKSHHHYNRPRTTAESDTDSDYTRTFRNIRSSNKNYENEGRSNHGTKRENENCFFQRRRNKDWILSKLRGSLPQRNKGMPGGGGTKGGNSKDGHGGSGGGPEQNKRHAHTHSAPPFVQIHIPNSSVEGCSGGENNGVSSEVGEDATPAAPDDPSNPRDGAASSSGSVSSCVSVSSSPTLSGGVDKKKRRHGHRQQRHHSHNHHNGKRLRHASTTESEENGSEASSTLEREAPDGGWGWVVVAAAFLVNLIADGVTFSFGVFFPTISDDLGTTKGGLAWVGSILAAVPLLSGPIASNLTDRFGCRKVTIVGGLLAVLGLVLSYFAENVYMLSLTFGAITGFGLSLCYVAAVVIVAYYFETKRSLATGLSACGGGIGTVVFALLSSKLIELYQWRTALLIVAGCFFLLCVCGVVMKDLEWTKRSSKKREKILQNEMEFNTQAQLNILAQAQQELKQGAYPWVCHHEGANGLPLNGLLKSDRLCNSALCIPTFVQEQERNEQNGRSRYYSNNYEVGDEGVNNRKNEIGEDTTDAAKECDKIGLDLLLFASAAEDVAPKANVTITVEEDKAQENMRSYVVRHTNHNFGKHRHSLTYRGAVLNLKRYRLRPATSCPDIISVATADASTTPEWRTVLSDLSSWMRGVFAWENLSNTRFVLFMISNFLLYTWYDIPYYFLADSAEDLGYKNGEGATLLSVTGLCNVLGNIILGYIGDRTWANSVTIYGICISICGIVTGLMPVFFTEASPENFYWLCVLSGMFGLMIAANYSLTPVILVQIVSLEKFANAYGLLLLVQGIGNLIGPPLAGCLRDYTKTWHWSFYIAGFGIFISNLFILAPIYSRHQRKHDLRGKEVSSNSLSNTTSQSGSIAQKEVA